MEQTKGITVKVPTELHAKAKAEQEASEMTMSEYISMVLVEHFCRNEGSKNMAGSRTMAFQIDEERFQRIKKHLARNPRLSQKSFVLGLIDKALDEAEKNLTQPGMGEPEKNHEVEHHDSEHGRPHSFETGRSDEPQPDDPNNDAPYNQSQLE